jgi:hypothetical protein
MQSVLHALLVHAGRLLKAGSKGLSVKNGLSLTPLVLHAKWKKMALVARRDGIWITATYTYRGVAMSFKDKSLNVCMW